MAVTHLNESPLVNAGFSKPSFIPVKRTPVKTSASISVFDLKHPFTVSTDLSQSVKVKDLAGVSREFKERFPKKFLVQLKAILEHLNLSLNSLPPGSIQAKPFGIKGFDVTDSQWVDGFYAQVSEAVIEWTSSFLADFNDCEHSLAEFFVDCCRQFIDKQKNSVPTSAMEQDLGSMLMIQIMLRQHEVRQYINLSEAVSTLVNSYSQLRSSQSIGNSILWILSQTPGDILTEDDLTAWFTLCLPAFDKMATCSSSSFQMQSIRLFESRFLDLIGERLFVDARNLVKMMFISQSDDSILKSTDRGLDMLTKLKSIYEVSRDATMKQPTREKQYVFQRVYDKMSTYGIDSKIFHEAAMLLLDLLRDDRALFAVWETKYHERPETTLKLLKFLDSRWSDYFEDSKYDFSYFTRFIKTVSRGAASKEDQRIVRSLMKKTSSNFGLVMFSIIIAVLSIIVALVFFQDFDYLPFLKSVSNVLLAVAKQSKYLSDLMLAAGKEIEHHTQILFQQLLSIYNKYLSEYFHLINQK